MAHGSPDICEPAPCSPGCRRAAPASEGERLVHLLEAALCIVVREGYSASNMDEIARTAGMSKKTIYKLFPSKAALFEALVRHHLAELPTDPSLDGVTGEAALELLLLSAAEVLLSPQHIGLFRVVAAEGARHPELAQALHRAGPASCIAQLEGWLTSEAAAGRLSFGGQPAAKMLLGMAIGATHSKMLLGLEIAPTPEALLAQVRTAIAVFMHGARTSPATS